jgi:hypothetical protein
LVPSFLPLASRNIPTNKQVHHNGLGDDMPSLANVELQLQHPFAPPRQCTEWPNRWFCYYHV